MRVLTYLHSFEPGGVEYDILRFNKAWADRGVDVRIALGRREGRLEEIAPDLPYTQFQTGRMSSAGFETLWMIWHLPRMIRAVKPDILFCGGNSYAVVAVAMRLLLGRNCPPMIQRISNDLVRKDMPQPIRAVYHWWLRLQAPYFAALVAMAEPARAEIIERMSADPGRVVAINNACLTQAEADRLAAARDAVVRERTGRGWLAIGRLASQKNFALLIEAFAKLARPDDRLTIVGEGPERAALEQLAARLGVANRLILAGHQRNVDSWLADADALVLSSDYEGLGIVVIEALAAGVPVVATDCSVNMAMLLEGIGTLVPVGDAGALANAMGEILTRPCDVAALRERAALFTVEANAPAWLALFERLVP